ncbi:MAG: aldo/keto reductase, partial [Acidimicrobiia bacterium]
ASRAGAGTVIRGGVARGIPRMPRENLEQVPDGFRPMIQARLDRFENAGLDDILNGMSRMEFMLRFTLTHPEMHTTIVGTANPRHFADNLAAASKGPLPEDVYEAARKRLDAI